MPPVRWTATMPMPATAAKARDQTAPFFNPLHQLAGAQPMAVNPCSHRAALGSADIELRAGRFEEATMRLERLIRYHPDNPEAFFALGTALARLGRHQEAIVALDRCLVLAPEHPGATGVRRRISHPTAGDAQQ